MSLRTAVAAPFKSAGTRRLGERAFVVDLAVDRDWFSPDQAARLVDIATGEGLVERENGELIARFDTAAVTVPEGFTPDESTLRTRSTFERIIGALTEAGEEKRDAVAAINELQTELGVTVEAAAVVYARRRGVEVDDAAAAAREEL
jgi:hypothetical protein